MTQICKAGNGNPTCDYKRNAKGSKVYELFGIVTTCAYEGDCVNKKEVKV